MFDATCARPFTQILHNGGAYWLVVTKVGTSADDEIIVMDSSRKRRKNKGKIFIPSHVVRQIANLLRPASSKMTLRLENVQQQTNGVDCALFAVAFTQYVLKHQT